MEDRRTRKTKEAIRRVFLSLLQEKPLNRITVSEISRMADLGRGTFYLHYSDVYDLYDQVENGLIQEMEQIFDAAYPSYETENLMALTTMITEYLVTNRDIFLLLMRQESGIIHKLRVFFSAKALYETPQKVDSESAKLDNLFIVSGVLGILEEWLHDGMGMSQERLSAGLHRIISKF